MIIKHTSEKYDMKYIGLYTTKNPHQAGIAYRTLAMTTAL